MRCSLLCVLLLLIVGCQTKAPTLYPPVHALPTETGDAYLGLGLWHGEHGEAFVSRILPGPLEGKGFTSPFMQRGDILLEADGQPVTAESFTDYMKTKQPGDSITLKVRRTEGDPKAAFPQAGKGTEEQTHTVTLGNRLFWTGPVHSETPADRSLPDIGGETMLETYLREQLTIQELREPVDGLLDLFRKTREQRQGFHMLSRVSYGFEHPMRFPQLCESLTENISNLSKKPELFFSEAAANLDASTPALPPREPLDFTLPSILLDSLDKRVSAAQQQLELAFREIDPDTLAAIPDIVDEYLTKWTFNDLDPHLVAHGLRATTRVDYGHLLNAGAIFQDLLGKQEPPDVTDWPMQRVPWRLRNAITGPIHAARRINGRWLVVGSSADNTYDLDVIDIVVDVGGNDTYTYADDPRQRIQVVFDYAGNDTYKGAGAVAACLGLSLVVDQGGDDLYEGQTRAVASALLGTALIVDHGGHDTYRSTSWAQGAAIYGAAAILDMNGNDVYWSHHCSQGIGGPRGFGLLFDAGGADVYRANGPTPSAYGTPAVFYGMSQGIGLGFRNYDTGGIGILHDSNGNDRYEAGEFSQGGGYYWGLGILNDVSGHDLYYGNRYGQGFGCHQALGALLDHRGNDIYWAMAAANQGAAWDIGMGLLLDYQGDDIYRANNLSQGSASMQAIGWLIDLDGTDTYHGSSIAQGHSSGNAYHYYRTHLHSWSLLLDNSGTADTYSNDRENGTIQQPGKANEENPKDSRLHGLFIDMAESLDLGLR